MLSSSLSPRDFNVLEKIKDPEFAPSAPILIDPTLPRDPQVIDPAVYESLVSAERRIIREFHDLESRIAARDTSDLPVDSQLLAEYDAYTANLERLIALHPTYASFRNNHAQALRRRYGESVLLKMACPLSGLAGRSELVHDEITKAARMILNDLNTAILLLSPLVPFSPISPQVANTLSQAYTQRGALYHITSKQIDSNPGACLRVDRSWTAVDLEEMASKDFMMGARYGNEIARGLVVTTNPMAKLCGSIVREAMRKEFDLLTIQFGTG